MNEIICISVWRFDMYMYTYVTKLKKKTWLIWTFFGDIFLTNNKHCKNVILIIHKLLNIFWLNFWTIHLFLAISQTTHSLWTSFWLKFYTIVKEFLAYLLYNHKPRNNFFNIALVQVQAFDHYLALILYTSWKHLERHAKTGNPPSDQSSC